MQDSPVLDKTVIKELQEVMGSDFALLVQSFVRDGEQRLISLQQARQDGDAEALRRQAHSFKGSSSNLGANQVSNACLAVEHAARDGELERVPALLEALEAAFQRACTALNRPA